MTSKVSVECFITIWVLKLGHCILTFWQMYLMCEAELFIYLYINVSKSVITERFSFSVIYFNKVCSSDF